MIRQYSCWIPGYKTVKGWHIKFASVPVAYMDTFINTFLVLFLQQCNQLTAIKLKFVVVDVNFYSWAIIHAHWKVGIVWQTVNDVVKISHFMTIKDHWSINRTLNAFRKKNPSRGTNLTLLESSTWTIEHASVHFQEDSITSVKAIILDLMLLCSKIKWLHINVHTQL